jgi:hypothetical protein
MHLGDLRVTNDPEPAARSVPLSVLSDLRLVRLDGQAQGLIQE